MVYCLFIPLGSSLLAEAPRAERKHWESENRAQFQNWCGRSQWSAATRGLINGVALTAQNGPKTMFFKDYSLLVVFDAYLRSKCTNPDIYTCDGAGLVVIRSLMTALCLSKKKKKKKKDEQFAWAAISVYHFRNVCQLRQWYFHAQNNRLINPRCLESRETL